MIKGSLGICILLGLATSCTPKKDSSSEAPAVQPTEVVKKEAAPPPTTQTAMSSEYERGKKVYRSQCIACHGFDPRKIGSSGPDVFGSSKELLSARILEVSYPKGYKPKRNTKMMIKLSHLKNEIDALTTYLNSPDPMK